MSMNLNKKNKIAIISLCLCVVSIITLVSYAYFNASVAGRSQEMVITTGHMSVSFSQGNIIGSSDNMIPGQSISLPFEVTNTGTVDAYYDLYFNSVINTFVDKNDLVYTLVSNDGGLNITETIAPSSSEKFGSGINIGVGETHHYTLTILFKDDGSTQDDNKGVTFSTVIGIEEIEIAPTPVYAYIYTNDVLINNYNTEQECDDEVNSTGKGICTAKTVDIYNLEGYDNYVLPSDLLSLEQCNNMMSDSSNAQESLSCELKENKYVIASYQGEFDTLEDCQNDSNPYTCEYDTDSGKYHMKFYTNFFDDENSCYDIVDRTRPFNSTCELKDEVLVVKHTVYGNTNNFSYDLCQNNVDSFYLGSCVPTGSAANVYEYMSPIDGAQYTYAFNSDGSTKEGVYVIYEPYILDYNDEYDYYYINYLSSEVKRRIKVVDFENMVVPYSTSELLSGIPFERIDHIDNLYTKYVRNMSSMFYNAGAAGADINLVLGNNFDTSNVENMSNMFNQFGYNANSLTIDLGNNFNTSNVYDMSNMFTDAGYNAQNFSLNLGNDFDTSNVTNGSSAFCNTGYSAGYTPSGSVPSSWSDCDSGGGIK